MFRLYEIYSLYKKKMSSYNTSPPWCICEKLPRSILHVPPRPDQWCEVCGRRRRPLAYSSSDEEIEKEPQMQRQGSVQVKVAVGAEEPNAMDDGEGEPSVARAVLHHQNQRQQPRLPLQQKRQQPSQLSTRLRNTPYASNNANRTYIGHFGHCPKPLGLPQRREEGGAVKLKERQDNDPESVDPPPPSPSPPPTPAGISGLPFESVWEQPNGDMPHLVVLAHEVFNRPLNRKSTLPSIYDDLFVSDFIPLDKPITDPAGGAISKQRLYGRTARLHCSRPPPPLSKILSATMDPEGSRDKKPTSGLVREVNNTRCDYETSQFTPFDFYEGPSEDALVVDSARLVLRQTNPLNIKQRTDLPSTQLATFESQPSSGCSSPFEAPSAKPPERPEIMKYAPLRVHGLMKTVAKSESSASSSSTSSSLSPKSVSSTLRSERSRGGEQPSYIEQKLPECRLLPLSIMAKILLLVEKPTIDSSPPSPLPDDPLQNSENVDKTEHKQPTESHKLFRELMGSLLISDEDDTTDSDENRSATIKNEENLTVLEETLPESQTGNDMSNELPLNSSNKSAAGEKYDKGSSKVDRKCKLHSRQRGGFIKGTLDQRSSSRSMWSMLSGFLTARLAKNKKTSPLKDSQGLKYGAINESTKGKPSDNQCCQKCGLKRKKREPLRNNLSPIKPINRNGVQTDTNPSATAVTKPTTTQVPLLRQAKPQQTMATKPIGDLLLTPRGGPKGGVQAEAKLPKATPTTGSTVFESCLGASSSVTPIPEPKKLQPALALRNLRLQDPLQKLKAEQQQSKPVVYHSIRITSTIYYACSEIIKPKMLACSSLIIGRMQQITLMDRAAQTARARICEFRCPDIQAKELLKRKHHLISEKLESTTTPIPPSESSQSTDECSVKDGLSAKKNRCYLPVWPAHPKLVRRRLIKYPVKQLELDSINNNENSTNHRPEPNESTVKPKPRRRKEDEMWIVNEKVHRKINEMMTKPIKLLTINAAETAQI